MDQEIFREEAAPVLLGAAIVKHPPRRWPYFLMMMMAIGSLTYAAVRFSLAKQTTPVAVTTPVVPEVLVVPSKLRITVVPATATIAIDGRAPHQGSPYLTELPPGEYNLTISHEGYQPAVLNLSIEPRESHTIHHVLEKGSDRQLANVVLKFDAKYAARLDEMDWQSTSPLQRDLAPGPHELVLKEQGETVWRKQFIAKAGAAYVFEPTVAELRRRNSPTAGLTRIAAAAAASATSGGATAFTPAPSPQVEPPPLPPQPPPPQAPASTTTDEGPQPAVRPPSPAVSAAPAAPKVVPPGSVTRVSGTTPTLRKAPGMPSLISVKLCIDTVGNVTSVNVLGDVPSRARRDLEKALGAWQYRTYRDEGRAVPVCFVASFAVA